MSKFAFVDPEQHPLYKRAARHAEDASQYHQGSGVHADLAASMVANHIEKHMETGDPKHVEAAKKWTKAAKEEAAQLRTTKGEWLSQRKWAAGPSGQATKEAKAASRKAGVNNEWD